MRSEVSLYSGFNQDEFGDDTGGRYEKHAAECLREGTDWESPGSHAKAGYF